MAKSSNGIGQYRGKMGGVVFSVRNGQQIIRQYQPVVANPKTELQVDQRRKAILVGKISHVFKADIIEGLNGSSKSARRARFNKLLLDAVTTTTVSNIRTASLNGLHVKIADGLADTFAIPENNGVMIDSGNVIVAWNDGQIVYEEGFTQLVRVVLLYMVTPEGSTGVEQPSRFLLQVHDVNLATRMLSTPIVNLGLGHGQILAWGIPIVGHKDNVMDANSNEVSSGVFYNNSGLSSLGTMMIGDSVFFGSTDYTIE